MLEAPYHMLNDTFIEGNLEYSLSFTPTDNETGMLALLREPIFHVLSQFLECKYDEWGQRQTAGRSFPGYGKLDNVMEGFHQWVRHFYELNKTRAEDFGIDPAYRCYDPYNMQARYFTSSAQYAHYASVEADRWPNINVARRNLEALDVVGVLANYPASLCLFEYHAGGGRFLTDECQTCEGTKLQVAKIRMAHETHNVPPHSTKSISNSTLQMIIEMTGVDQELYKIAMGIFHRDVEKIRHETGIDLLCRPTNTTSAVKHQKREEQLTNSNNSVVLIGSQSIEKAAPSTVFLEENTLDKEAKVEPSKEAARGPSYQIPEKSQAGQAVVTSGQQLSLGTIVPLVFSFIAPFGVLALVICRYLVRYKRRAPHKSS